MPSGATPQRREFVYPRQLMKLQSRSELLESLRSQQEELQAAMEEEEEEPEDDLVRSRFFISLCLLNSLILIGLIPVPMLSRPQHDLIGYTSCLFFLLFLMCRTLWRTN